MEQTLRRMRLKRFSLGDELRAYTFLGCHAAERDGVHGYVFRVWAPRAQAVSVTGDCNFWNDRRPADAAPRRHAASGRPCPPMRKARASAYKFYVRRCERAQPSTNPIPMPIAPLRAARHVEP